MIINIECPRCNGEGEVIVSATIGVSGHTYTNVKPCPKCAGTGTVEHDLSEDCDD